LTCYVVGEHAQKVEAVYVSTTSNTCRLSQRLLITA